MKRQIFVRVCLFCAYMLGIVVPSLFALPIIFDYEGNVPSGNTTTPKGWSRLVKNTSIQRWNPATQTYKTVDVSLCNFYLAYIGNPPSQQLCLRASMNPSMEMGGIGTPDSVKADIITPKFLMEEGEHTVYFQYAFAKQGFRPAVYAFVPGDTLCVQISSDEKTWHTIYQLHAGNIDGDHLNLTWGQCNVSGYDKKNVQLRFVYESVNSNSAYIGNIKVERNLPCKYTPSVSIVDAETKSNTMGVKWTAPQNSTTVVGYNVKAYNVRTQTWERTFFTEQRNLILDYLEPYTPYCVSIQTLCEGNEKSYFTQNTPQKYTLKPLAFLYISQKRTKT